MSELRTQDASATSGRPAGNVVDVFSHRYLAHAASQLPGRPSSALSALARESLAFGATRGADQTLIKVAAIDAATTAIDIVTADAPYLVDSVRAELGRLGHAVERVLHPQIVVIRDAKGQISEILDIDDNAEVPDGASTESWMHVEIDAVDEPTAAGLSVALRRVLDDVHHAVTDAPAMYQIVLDLADELQADPGNFDRETSSEAAALLRWLANGAYMILGHAAYSANELASPSRTATPADARGVLRGDATISPLELLPAFRSGAPLIIFKSPLVSRVRRSAHYDCVTVVTPARADGPSSGQTMHVFLGLITTSEEGTVGRVPVVRKRIAEILLRSGVRGNSHTGRQLLAALRTLPRDELLEAPTADLLRLAQLVVARAEQGQVGVFARTHLNRDFISVLVYFPADRFGPETRRRVRDLIVRHWPGELIDRDDRIVELGFARMQFLIALRPGTIPPSPERHIVEQEVLRVTRRWSDDLADLLTVGHGEEEGERLARRYDGAFPEAYKEDFGAGTAVDDLKRLEGLPEDDGLAFHVYTPPAEDDADRRLKVFRTGKPLSLARALPIFTQMGIEVLDERPYEITRPSGAASEPTVGAAPGPTVGAAVPPQAPGPTVGAAVPPQAPGPTVGAAWIYDFGLRLPSDVDLDAERASDVIDTMRLLWRGEIEQDGFNGLVLRAGLTWWQANVLRAYAKYLRQAGTTFSQGYIEQALIEHASVAYKLVQLFESRFDPAQAGKAQIVDDGQGGTLTLVESIESDLAAVASLDQDRILRSLLRLINATLRTNAYRTDESGTRRAALALKLEPRRLPDLPEPRPKFEIWVYSPRVEGVHLRFGLIARGGIRWSDRREDFRTEILGLVKAQMVKNAVIVPVGAKGGFVAKRMPDPSDRDACLGEGVACYRTFVSCLLDLTDNRDVSGKVVPPPQTRRYDGDDPYLVVAADKGTAKFSDIANAVASDYGFWLGDAFASGGSQGYDHKAMGITARGAWESVKYHFRELDVNTQEDDFTVVGVGDMSGDVFGNGMLLSEHIRLIAAFDHQHVFLDPDPDPARSFAERQRLFALPRSSWADYDTALISTGGGVFPRTLKAIPITAQVRVALSLPENTRTLTPSELIHAILTAPVDLLWNGGIGTYVKASTETHGDAGDKANDAVRADGSELRCRVVGEGGNLGFTQRGRIEFARAGGRINTDAIDNSAGVDISDHEVNLKILLDRAIAAGRLGRTERNKLLASVGDDVAAHVLRDNYEQNVMLAMTRYIGPSMVTVHARLLRALEDAGRLDRKLEALPTPRELAQREAAAEGLSSPEMAVVAAYVKIVLTEQIADSMVPDESWFQRVLFGYFPAPIANRFAGDLSTHPLRHELITTCVVNDMVNRSGTTFVHRAMEETGADSAQITRAYTISREVFGLERLWADIEALDNEVPTPAQHAAYHEIRRLIDRATRWLLDVRFPITDVAGEIDHFAATVAELSPQIPDLLRGSERENLYADVDRLVGLGLPRNLAVRISELLTAFLLLDVVEIAQSSGRPASEVARLHFAVSDRFSVDEMLTRITDLPRDDRWSTLARAALRHDLYSALSTITTAVLSSTDEGLSATKRLAKWEKANSERVARARATVTEALARDTVDLATLSVALRVMRGLPT